MRLMILIALIVSSSQLAFGGIDRSKVKALAIGKTSEADLLRTFGKPAGSQDNADGSRTVTFSGGRIIPNPQLTVVVSRDGTVKDWTYQEFAGITGLRKLDPALLGKLVEGTTSVADVERLLGKPGGRVEKADGTSMLTYQFRNKQQGDPPTAHILMFDRGGVLASDTGSTVPKMQMRTGPEIDEARWELIFEGRTTGDEVIELLGKPSSVFNSPDGSKMLSYMDLNWTHPGGGIYQVLVGPDGIVASLNRTANRVNRKTGKFESGQAIDPGKWAAIRVGVTTEADIIEMFGQPGWVLRRRDESKTYFYQYTSTEIRHLRMRSEGENRAVTFDARGVVRNQGAFKDPNVLELRKLDADVVPAWDALARQKPLKEALVGKLGAASCTIAPSGKPPILLYLYSSENGDVTAYALKTTSAGAWDGVARAAVGLRDVNALGRKILRTVPSMMRPGETSEQQIAADWGTPPLRISTGDGENLMIYVSGILHIRMPGTSESTQSSTMPSIDFTQAFGVVSFLLDPAGVLKSAMMGCAEQEVAGQTQ